VDTKSLLVCLGLLAMLLVAGGCVPVSPQAKEPPRSPTEALPTFTFVPPTRTPVPSTATPSPEAPTATALPESEGAVRADVISVEASGQPGAVRFSVGIRSPDTGCDQYADW
jgi:hypothetical protein